MKIQGKQLYVSIQCTCIDINMAELRVGRKYAVPESYRAC